MNRLRIILLTTICCVATMPFFPIYANEYEGSEAEWLKKCSTAQDSEAAANECKKFKEYYHQQTNHLNDKISDMKKTSDQLEADMSNIRELIAQLDEQIKGLNQQLESAEESISVMRNSMIQLDTKMAEKQEEIAMIDKQIKKRMEAEQVNVGTNRYIDMLMGATDLMDIIELIEGIKLITENDQAQMADAAKVRAEYQLQKEEQTRISEDLKEQIKANEALKQAAEAGKKEQGKLYQSFYAKEQEVKKEMENAQASASDMQGALASINTNIRDDIFQKPNQPTEGNQKPTQKPDNKPSDDSDGNDKSDDNKNDNTNDTPDNNTDDDSDKTPDEQPSGNSSFIKPIAYPLYAGTWYYPSDPWDTQLYEHIGADYSGPIGGAIVAPARSIVLYANDPFQSDQYGPSLGWPRGGANTIELLTQVNGTTYAISFFHLAKGILVSAGDVVEQGQTIAYSGASGNVTGPHLHIELVNLGTMSVTEAQARFAQNADFGWGSGWTISSACSNRGYTPCRERPEEFFGY